MLSFNVSTIRRGGSSPPKRYRVKIRWFGLLVGFVLVNSRGPGGGEQAPAQRCSCAGRLVCDSRHLTTACAAVFFFPGNTRFTSPHEAVVHRGCCVAWHGGPRAPSRYYYFAVADLLRHSALVRRSRLLTYALHAVQLHSPVSRCCPPAIRPLDLL